MKLKEFSPKNIKTVRVGQPVINMNGKSGLISFSKAFAESIDLKGGEAISFHQDEDRPKDWYIEITPDGFPSRKKDDGVVLLQSTVLVRTILKSVEAETHTASFLMAITPIENGGGKLYAIITKSGKN